MPLLIILLEDSLLNEKRLGVELASYKDFGSTWRLLLLILSLVFLMERRSIEFLC